jgi:hypothetical protein
VEDALAVTDWARFQRPDFVEHIRRRTAPVDLGGPARTEPLAGNGGLPNAFLEVSRLCGTGQVALPYRDCLQSITVLEGKVTVDDVEIGRGRSAVVPACAADLPLALSSAHAVICAVA